MASDQGNSLPMFVVDAFTDVPFTGNPAAVCLLTQQSTMSDEMMQKIASEMNLSETAFIRRHDINDTFNSNDRFGLRWFTPSVEVALCGHATLASAAVLFYCVGNKSSTLTFDTLSGPLTAIKDGDYICLNFPLNDPQPVDKLELVEMNDMIKSLIGDMKRKDVLYSPTTKKLLVRLDDNYTINDLETLKASTSQMTSLDKTGKVRGVIVTVKGDTMSAISQIGYDFASRYFGPWVGISEDPVTGSAHTVLGPYWSRVLNKDSLFARQCSRRGGDLRLTIRHRDNRIEIAGRCIVMMQASLMMTSTST